NLGTEVIDVHQERNRDDDHNQDRSDDDSNLDAWLHSVPPNGGGEWVERGWDSLPRVLVISRWLFAVAGFDQRPTTQIWRSLHLRAFRYKITARMEPLSPASETYPPVQEEVLRLAALPE